MADLARSSFKWSQKKYTLKEIEVKYGGKLPQIVLVSDGYSAPNSPYAISSDDIYFIKSIAKQPRLVVADENDRLLSIPLDYRWKFHVVNKSKSGGVALGPSRKLREILHHNALNSIKQIMLEMNESVSVLIGAEKTISSTLGVITVHDIYHERYYLAHSIFNDAKMHPYQVEFPVYVPVTVRLAIGMTMADDKKMVEVLSRAKELVMLDPDSEEAFDICFNPEIMLFEARDDDDYEYINPGGILDWAVKAEMKVVERVYGASKTTDTRRRRKEQENWMRRQDSNPEMLDIGIPIPSQLLPNDKPHVNSKDPSVARVLRRPESPTPSIPIRGEKSSVHIVHHQPHKEDIRSPGHKQAPMPRQASVKGPRTAPKPNNDKGPGPNFQAVAKAKENQEHKYKLAAFAENRPCGDGGNEVYTPALETDAQKRALNSGHIVQWADVPDDISNLTVGDVNTCLRLLNISKEVDVDGKFLLALSEEEFKDFFQMNGLEAKKLFQFAAGWRPKF